MSGEILVAHAGVLLQEFQQFPGGFIQIFVFQRHAQILAQFPKCFRDSALLLSFPESKEKAKMGVHKS
ncbi:hypothetical protein DC3_42410 [Deinococcus cellulosilyticus NBRC 106333 = KACC 11606]|uniref:Uncharacterized protein n=1 Tax=Deinococcus cellulosilyticus (strain DSM 18568 / NBRC 106333 / KACC 11606 / 5516J-15) TaxID=1223518 RepID=A0A511N7Z7_DEIC1|nr:hypothetical protein DC3_42410 [Deinococcus cellulosilyticus NBRC 106333 = KACC 11606]